jgi:hypothetical protein
MVMVVALVVVVVLEVVVVVLVVDGPCSTQRQPVGNSGEGVGRGVVNPVTSVAPVRNI